MTGVKDIFVAIRESKIRWRWGRGEGSLCSPNWRLVDFTHQRAARAGKKTITEPTSCVWRRWRVATKDKQLRTEFEVVVLGIWLRLRSTECFTIKAPAILAVVKTLKSKFFYWNWKPRKSKSISKKVEKLREKLIGRNKKAVMVESGKLLRLIISYRLACIWTRLCMDLFEEGFLAFSWRVRGLLKVH